MTSLKALLIILGSTLILHAGAPIKKFIPDDFPVTNKMFEWEMRGNGRHYGERRSRNIETGDQAWFTNDSLHQTLVYDLYTDYFRMGAFLFDNNNIPKGLVNLMELNTSDGGLASNKDKEKALKGLIRQSTKVKSKYFTSGYGIHLGSAKEAIIKAYGRPDKTSRKDSLETLEWNFIGDEGTDEKERKGRRVAAGSFGHQITAFFQDGKLIALILHNDIP
ncbi:MAG TPA: hypothetical protein VHD83_02790 [Puia sp.]|nr:hypothetical protein [Puia sp.]